MRRVLVPLDGTDRAEAILPDARRLAGANGELILVNDATIIPYWWVTYPFDQEQAINASRQYLDELAEKLRDEGVKVQEEITAMGDAALAIDEAATIFQADMVAVSTRARGALGRLFRGSIAWRAVANSPVPVLLRHTEPDDGQPFRRLQCRILVPLDGSALAEEVLPLARELATEWEAPLWLVHVVSRYPITEFPRTEIAPDAATDDMALRSSQRYLAQLAAVLGGDVHTQVLFGSPIDELVVATSTLGISDIVMSSHGRTGLSRVILGSVADALIHRLDLPIIVVPALARDSGGWSGEETATRAGQPPSGPRRLRG